jgi:hypothetical protein
MRRFSIVNRENSPMTSIGERSKKVQKIRWYHLIFDSAIRRFDPSRPSQLMLLNYCAFALNVPSRHGELAFVAASRPIVAA